MTSQSNAAALGVAVKAFEFKVDSEVTVDDIECRDQWKRDVNEAFDHMRELVEQQHEELHAKVFAEIASQEPAESAEIQQMQHSDERIAELMDVAKAHLAVFALGTTPDGRGPDMVDQLTELRTVSHELAACILAQEAAVTAWFAESFEPEA